MAAPSSVTLSRPNGKYVLNKNLSDSVDSLLALQGISWPLRKAALLATPKLSITSETRDDGVLCIEITSTVAGMPGSGSTEKCTLDWSAWERRDPLLGHYTARMGFRTASELPENRFLRGALPKDASEAGRWCQDEDDDQEKFVVIVLESCKDGDGWSAEHVWGFEIVQQARRYTRRLAVTKGERVELARLVYDYIGEV